MVKVCRVCGEGQPESEFYFDRSSGKLRNACQACERERSRARYDPEKMRAKYRANLNYYRDKNLERSAARAARRVGKKPELPDRPILARPCLRCGVPHSRRSPVCSKTCDSALRSRDWRNHNSRRRTKASHSDLTTAMVTEIMESRTYCTLCRKRMSAGGPHAKHLDHIVPIAIGGTHTLGNVRVICATCNMSRPWDGSDLAGHQPTLWAADHYAAAVAASLRPGRAPVVRLPSQRVRLRKMRREGLRECRRLESQLAYLFRLHGAHWKVIADRFGFARESGAYNFVYANNGGYVAPRLRP